MAIEIADPLELQVVEMINAERADAGLPPVHTEVHLNASAQGHSNWMAEEGVLSHTGEEGSTPSDRAEDADFPMRDGSWKVTENVAYSSISGPLDEGEIARMHSELMDSPVHKANILDPDVSYVGVGLSQGQIEAEAGLHEVVFLTQNFGDSSQPVLVQQDMNGETVLTHFVHGDAVPGTSYPAPDTDMARNADDDTDEEDEDDPQDAYRASGGSCFVATAAYGNRMHPDVVILRRFRDEILVRHRSGRAFVRFYWVVGPGMAQAVRRSHIVGRLARLALLPVSTAARKTLQRRGG